MQVLSINQLKSSRFICIKGCWPMLKFEYPKFTFRCGQRKIIAVENLSKQILCHNSHSISSQCNTTKHQILTARPVMLEFTVALCNLVVLKLFSYPASVALNRHKETSLFCKKNNDNSPCTKVQNNKITFNIERLKTYTVSIRANDKIFCC